MPLVQILGLDGFIVCGSHKLHGGDCMDSVIQIIITVGTSMLASSGLWAYISKRMDQKDVKNLMLIGLAHDRIVSLGMFYIKRGDWITNDEYENLNEYLFKPYKKLGGNGSAERIMMEVNKLRLVAEPPSKRPIRRIKNEDE